MRNPTRDKLLNALGQTSAIVALDLNDVTEENLTACRDTAKLIHATLLEIIQELPAEIA